MTHDSGWGPQDVPPHGQGVPPYGPGAPPYGPGAPPYGQSVPPYGQGAPYGQGIPPHGQGIPPYGQGIPPYGGVPPYGWGWMAPLPPKPGAIPLGPPLGLGDIISGSFATLSRGFTSLLGIGAALYGALLLLIGILGGTFYLLFQDTLERMDDYDEGPTAGLVVVGGLELLIAVTAALFVTGALTALAYVLLEPAVVGHRLSMREAWQRARSRAWAMIGIIALAGLIVLAPVLVVVIVIAGLAAALSGSSVGIAVLLGIVLGLAALVYTVWMAVLLSLAPAVAVLEDASVTRSLRRSAQLVRGTWWRTLGISMLGRLIASAASQVIQLVVWILIAVGGGIASAADSAEAALPVLIVVMLIGVLAVMVAGLFTNTFMLLISGLLYVDRRIRTEDLAPALLEAAGLSMAPQDQQPYPYDGGYPAPHQPPGQPDTVDRTPGHEDPSHGPAGQREEPAPAPLDLTKQRPPEDQAQSNP